jgi:hypothetical protein
MFGRLDETLAHSEHASFISSRDLNQTLSGPIPSRVKVTVNSSSSTVKGAWFENGSRGLPLMDSIILPTSGNRHRNVFIFCEQTLHSCGSLSLVVSVSIEAVKKIRSLTNTFSRRIMVGFRHCFIVQPIEVLFLLSHGKKQKRLFKTENDLAEYLTATHATEAPISFSYADGSCVEAQTLDRISARIFKARGLE